MASQRQKPQQHSQAAASGKQDAPLRTCPRCDTANPPQARFCKSCRFRLLIEARSGERYRIMRVVKSGGMGAVYEAEDGAGRRYAIKELLDRFGDQDERAERVTGFLNEAELLQLIRHPQIPRFAETWDDSFVDQATGERRMHHYLVLEFIDGEDLEQLLEREGAQPEDLVLRWAASLCDVLSYLHHQDLIYRDLKPSNIMLARPGGELKLIDFGIVMRRGAQASLIGTPGYSPPEQYQGRASQASDIYALGATLHHLLTGRDPRREPPFSFPPLRQLQARVSPQVDAAVMRALAMEPAERWGSMDEFKQALLPPAPLSIPAPRPRAPAQVEALARPDEAPAPVQSAPASDPAAPTGEQARERRGGRLWRWLRSLFLIALIAASAGYLATQRPDLLQPERYLPAAQAPAADLVAREQRYELEIVAPISPGSVDDVALYAYFELAFDTRLREDFGPDARRDPGAPLRFDSPPLRLGGDPVSPRYSATLSGRVLIPAAR